jgi:anthranilate synthase component I
VNLIPLYTELPAELLTPVSVYLKLSLQNKSVDADSFLFESVAGGAQIGRYSFIGSHPYKTIAVDDTAVKGDPLHQVDLMLKDVRYASLPNIPSFPTYI